MKYTKHLVFLISAIAITIVSLGFASAFADITSVEVNGVDALTNANDIAVFAGEVLPVRVFFDATATSEDARIKVWVSGSRDNSFTSERFDVISGGTYSRLVSVQVPFDIDPSEPLRLEVSIESRNDGEADRVEIKLAGQRESYIVEALDVNMDTKVIAGQSVVANIVLKNRGRQFAEDTFVRARIPALGVEGRVYFGDLSDIDRSDPDKEDAVERRLVLNIPSKAPSGVYVVEFDIFNADFASTVSKRIAIVGASEDSRVVSSAKSRTFSAGQTASYSLTLVNAGSNVRVYEIEVVPSTGLNVEVEEPVVAVPAGTSKTVKIEASSKESGRKTFTVNVIADGETVQSETFTANVEGKGIGAGNATVVLTVILAIIFVILLVVLIVLLTRKPEKKEEFGESYY